MLRSPLGRKFAGRARAARRFALIVSLFAFAASLPFITEGAGQQEVQPRSSSRSASKGQANIIAGAKFVPGEVLVRFRSDASAKTAEVSLMSLSAGNGVDVNVRRFEGSDMVDGLRLATVDAARTLEAVAELADRSDVLYAEPNYIWRTQRTPNDPRFPEMYGMNRISAPAAWDTTIGSRSVVVGVIDGGVDINHPDLKDNIWTNPGETPNNNFDDDGNGLIDDVNGWDFHHNDKTVFDNDHDNDDHATHVAGTLGATGNNGVGVTGVNWEVSIMSLKALGDRPDGTSGGSVSNIINAYNYARQMRERGVNIRVLNNSYGGPGKSQAALDAINQLNNAGILFVAAAGNGGGDSVGDDNYAFPDFPSSYNVANVIAVASTNSGETLSGFSNFSSRLVSIGAPGSSILSTTPNNTYSVFNGTSMASPHVAGAAALVIAAKPDIALGTLRGALAYSGDRLSVLETRTTTGRRLNVAKAIESALENDGGSPGFMFDFRVIAQTGRSVTLSWTAPPDDQSTGAGACADYDFYFRDGNFGVALPTTVQPAAPGTQQTVTVNVPYRHFSGTIEIRAIDNVGNANGSSANVTVPVNVGSDPYVVTQSAAQALTTSTATNLFPTGGDDKYTSYNLPFSFPFFGVDRTNLTVSTNGALYFSPPPRRGPTSTADADDSSSSSDALQGQIMIAGLWDDVDINRTSRPDSGVYVTQDASRVVFRWQGIPCNPTQASGGACTGGGNLNFEIELRNDGTILMRYGQNVSMFPVVGISGGEPDAYVVTSHTSETFSRNLSNAQTVTFAPRVATLYSISGSVRDANGAGVPNVTLFLGGGSSAVTMSSGSGGTFSFNGLAADLAYTVTPSHPNFNFSPTSISIASLTSNQGANFIATSNIQAGPNSVGFAQASSQVNEADPRVTFTVTRTGDTSAPMTLDYRTVDTDTFTIGCADASGNQGGAYGRCDFATTVGRLSFAANELSKTIIVPLVDDGHDEGAETFQLQLSNAVGAGTTLGAQNVSTVTIQDDDGASAPNPIITLAPSNYSFFVRQQYLDFLSREPEAGEPWSAVLARCANVNTGPATDTDCDRIAVSAAIFGSPEFQIKGFYVFRFYKVAFNRLPQYAEIVSDMSFLAGATTEEVYARRAQLANAFTTRPEFITNYGGLNNSQFVTALFNRYTPGLTSITTPDPLTPDSGTRITLSSADLTSRLDGNLLTRAQVLRAVADSDQVQALEFNNAFVAIQYYGYLRRTPEEAGYQANLLALQRGVSRREMVNGFLNSTEYRLRFGQ